EVVRRGTRRAEARAKCDEPSENSAAFGRRQILLAQADPAAAAAKGGFGHLDQGPPRLIAIGNDQQRRIGKPHSKSSRYGFDWPSNRSASTVTRITVSSGSATGGAGAARLSRPGHRRTARP